MEKMEVWFQKFFVECSIVPLDHPVDPWTPGIDKHMLDSLTHEVGIKIPQELQSIICLDISNGNGIHHLQLLEEVNGVFTVEMRVWEGIGKLHPYINARVEVDLHGIDDLHDSIHLQVAKVHGFGCIFHPEVLLLFLLRPF